MSKTTEEGEQQEKDNRQAPSAKLIHDVIFQEAVEELERSSSALFWSALAAGLSMGFSMVSEAFLMAYLPDADWSVLVSSFGYSVGFIIVILGRQQLFTENTLLPILPLLHRRDFKTFRNVSRLWLVVLFANLLGALIFAWVVGRTSVFAPEVQQAFIDIGHKAMKPSFWTILLRGIFAGWLIALLVWLLPFAETARVWVILLITYVVAVSHLSHVIVGSIEVFTLAAMQEASWLSVLWKYSLPALIGNVIGGVVLTAAINHAQVKANEGE